MKPLKTFLAFILLSAIGFPSTAGAYKAKKDNPVSFGVNISYGFPQRDFGKFSSLNNMAIFSVRNNEGSTATEGGVSGINFGLDFKAIYAFNKTGLKVYAKIGIHEFNIKPDIDLMNKDIYASREVDFCGTSFYNPTLFNIPSMVGARFDLSIKDYFGLFFEAGLGANLRLMNKYYIKTDGFSPALIDPENGLAIKSIDDFYKPQAALSFAYELGLGLNLTHWCSLGFFYINLGKASVKASHSQTYSFSDKSQRVTSSSSTLGSISQQLWAIRLGLNF